MKKFALFVMLAFIATDTGIWAQHYVRYSANTGCTNRIVQSCPVYTNLTEVLYTRDNVSGYLVLWVEGVAACRISVPLAYEVKDMKVYGNLLYFCGRSKPYGFIAVANLHDMFQHAMGYGVPPSNAVVAYTLLDNRFVSSLEKLVVYGENGVLPTFPNYNANEHIAAIGRGGSQTTSDRVVVYIKYNNLILNPSIPFLPTVVTVEVLDDLTSPSGDPLQEVLLTDDYVAFVRFRDASSEYVIHRCDKYSLAATYNTIYKYATPAYEITSSEDAVTLENNNIALATSSLSLNMRYVMFPITSLGSVTVTISSAP